MSEKLSRKIDLTKSYIYKRYCTNFADLENINPDSYNFYIYYSKPDIPEKQVLTGKNGTYLVKEPISNSYYSNKTVKQNSLSEILGDRELSQKSFHIMGILNVTPDSFSDGGKYNSIDKSLAHAEKMFEEGVDIIDIGGESTRPGSASVSVEEEISRVVPVIKEIRKQFPRIKISIDTTKSEVAGKAVNVGADVVNDISAFSFDPGILDLCATDNIPLIAMHMKGTPATMQIKPRYEDVIEEILQYFDRKIAEASNKNFDKLILDPGIGFGKRVRDNYEIIDRANEFKIFGYPVLIGLSKKSYIGKSLNLEVDQRENATVISEIIAVQNGADIIRTHNVKYLNEARKLLNFYKEPDLADNV